MVTEVATVLSAIGTLAAAVFAAHSARTAHASVNAAAMQAEISRQQLTATIHHNFQERIRDIQHGFSSAINEEGWMPESDAELRLIQLYWYVVFDEWFTCTKFLPQLTKLWDDTYVEGVKSALRRKAFRDVLSGLFEGESSFLGHAIEFREVLEKINYSVTGFTQLRRSAA
jgi:hypothetical protein